MPAPRLPWIKFWPEALEHEKFAQLNDAESWTWVVIWAKASLQPKRWRFASIEHAHRVTNRPKAHIRRLVESGLLDDGPDGLVVHDAPDWQDAEKITPGRRKGDRKGDPTLTEPPPNGASSMTEHGAKHDGKLTQRVSKADGRLTNKPTKGDLEGEGDRERDIERDVNLSVSAETPSLRGKARRQTEVTDELCQLMEDEYWEAFGSRQAARDVIDHAMGHKARLKCSDQRAYLRNWVRDDAEKAAVRRGGRNGLSLVVADERHGAPPCLACGGDASVSRGGKCLRCAG